MTRLSAIDLLATIPNDGQSLTVQPRYSRYEAATMLIMALTDATPNGALVCLDGEQLTIEGYNRVMQVVNNTVGDELEVQQTD